MSFPALFFEGLLKTLAGQLFVKKQDYAECKGEGFGPKITQNAKKFFSISVAEEVLPDDLVALGVLADNRVLEKRESDFTFFAFIDSSKVYEDKTDDFKTMFQKKVLSHEICHFVFYYELFFRLGDNLTSTVYTSFQNKVSGKQKNAVTEEVDATNETMFDNHKHEEFMENFWRYSNSHWDAEGETDHDYWASNRSFLRFLTSKY